MDTKIIIKGLQYDKKVLTELNYESLDYIDAAIEALAKLSAMESQKPLCVVENKSLAKLADGKEAKVYGCSPHMLYNPDYHSNLYAKPVPADKPERITEQDAMAILLEWDAYRAERSASGVTPAHFKKWLNLAGRALLNKLNADREQVPAVAVPECVKEAVDWLKAAIECEKFIWDWDQLDAAKHALSASLGYIAADPSHSQQSARITSADQFIDGQYYWCKFTNPNAVYYGETVIWQFTQSIRDAPFLAHHPVDAELFAKTEIYGPVPMPDLSRDRCPIHESEQGGCNE